jgi:amyloid beta precursor protein binding protein 1
VRLELILSVVDSHPDSTHTLRIDAPFPALEAYAKGLDLGSMDSMEHSHVPWVVLLVKAASTWKDSVGDLVTSSADDQHGGQVPRDLSDDGGPDEQREFKALLNGTRHKADEENFDEALAQAYQVWGESQVGQLLYKW